MSRDLNMSKNLEDLLRQALQREAPPAGFAERVVLQAESARAHRLQTPRPRFRFLWPAATFAATTALVFSISIEYHSIQEERAGRQAIQALQIASQELNLARNQVLNQ
jgi:hypothetical protein